MQREEEKGKGGIEKMEEIERKARKVIGKKKEVIRISVIRRERKKMKGGARNAKTGKQM